MFMEYSTIRVRSDVKSMIDANKGSMSVDSYLRTLLSPAEGTDDLLSRLDRLLLGQDRLNGMLVRLVGCEGVK